MRLVRHPAWTPAPDPRRHLSDVQVATTALIEARYFGGNLAQARRYMQANWGQRELDKSGISQQLHPLKDVLDELFATFNQVLQTLHTGGGGAMSSTRLP